MKRKVAMAMVAAMAVGSLAVPVMAEDGAAGGKIGISMPTQSLERWNRDGSYLQKQFEDAGYEVELTYSDNETDRQVNDIQNLISDGVNLLVVAAIDVLLQINAAILKFKEQNKEYLASLKE